MTFLTGLPGAFTGVETPIVNYKDNTNHRQTKIFFHIRVFCLRKKLSGNFYFAIYTRFYFFLPIISTISYFVLQVKYLIFDVILTCIVVNMWK